MGLLDGRSNSYSGSRREHSPSARSTRSHHSSSGKDKSYFVRPAARTHSSGSIFGGSTNGGRDNYSSSRGLFGGSSRGIFSGFGGGSSSYYKRSPRQGYIGYLYAKLRRMLRELWYYARRHPMKAFFAVVVPLLSAGGAIHGLMRQFGVKVPGMDGGARTMRGGYYGSSGYGGGSGGLMDSIGGMGGMGGVMQIAKAFM